MSEENKKALNDEEIKMILSDEELDKVTGGYEGHSVIGSLNVIRRDSKGNPTHFEITHDGKTTRIWHYVCPHCGGLLHQGFLGRMYCDPCDESWFAGVSLERVEGFYPGCE